MNGTRTLIITIVFLLAAIFAAGCASPSTPAPVQTQPPTTIVPTSIPTTVSMTTQTTIAPISTTTPVTSIPVVTSTEKEILHEKGMLTTTTFQTYDFKTLGYKFLYPNDKFRITLKSEKPVLGYAVNSEQALQLQGSTLVPHYESYSKNIQWGLVKSSMVLEKATDVTKEFTVEEVGPISYVVDGRWMSFEPIYDGTPPFSYELIITKTSGPTAQNFNFK
jgi:hypothetical protein